MSILLYNQWLRFVERNGRILLNRGKNLPIDMKLRNKIILMKYKREINYIIRHLLS